MTPVKTAGRLGVTVMSSLAGALAFQAASVPAGELVGAITATAILVLAGYSAYLPRILRDLATLVIGIAIGSAVSPELLAHLPTYAGSLSIFVFSSVVGTLSAYLYLTRIEKWNVRTAQYSALPGSLAAVIAEAMDHGADVAKVAVAQVVRQWTVIAVVSLSLAFGNDAPVAEAAAATASTTALTSITLLLCASGAVLLHWFVPGVSLLVGGMMVSALLHGSGLLGVGVAPEIEFGAFVLLGAAIGTQLLGVTTREIATYLRPAIGAAILALLVTAAFALVSAYSIFHSDFWMFWFAYAPGGVELMVSLAFATGVDAAFVALHHLARIMLLNVTMLVLSRK